jgi:hypothetical protein
MARINVDSSRAPVASLTLLQQVHQAFCATPNMFKAVANSNRCEHGLAALHEVGFTDEHVMEVLAHVALNLFTNYVNVAFDVPVDFPRVALR